MTRVTFSMHLKAKKPQKTKERKKYLVSHFGLQNKRKRTKMVT